MNVLSLFDGISCGRVALERANIKVKKYYASEVDKYAIQISKKNYPEIMQLGDINYWQKWDIPKPDLIMGGSPCQGFSFAGKQLAFDDPRSALFFKFVEVLNYYKPKYFLFENVRMKQDHQDVISKYLGVKPIVINSALVSAQNRVRYYWTNIPNVTQPEDRHIYLKDIIDVGVVDRDKSYCIDSNYWKGGNLKQYFEKHRRQLVFNQCQQNGFLNIKGQEKDNRVYEDIGKSPALLSHSGGGKHVKVLQTSLRGRRLTEDGKRRDDKNGKMVRGYEVRPDGKTCALTTVQKDNYVTEDYVIRKLTPLECERLQTLPDNFSDGLSNHQRYKVLGNGWTVDVIAHILSFIKQT
jgi:DNA-cytosine methyltransferase